MSIPYRASQPVAVDSVPVESRVYREIAEDLKWQSSTRGFAGLQSDLSLA